MFETKKARRLVLLLARFARMGYETALELAPDEAQAWLDDALLLEEELSGE